MQEGGGGSLEQNLNFWKGKYKSIPPPLAKIEILSPKVEQVSYFVKLVFHDFDLVVINVGNS